MAALPAEPVVQHVSEAGVIDRAGQGGRRWRRPARGGHASGHAGHQGLHEGDRVRFAVEHACRQPAPGQPPGVAAKGAVQKGVELGGPGEAGGQIRRRFGRGQRIQPVQPGLDLGRGPVGGGQDLDRIARALDLARRHLELAGADRAGLKAHAGLPELAQRGG